MLTRGEILELSEVLAKMSTNCTENHGKDIACVVCCEDKAVKDAAKVLHMLSSFLYMFPEENENFEGFSPEAKLYLVKDDE